jgi:hypothetical protein
MAAGAAVLAVAGAAAGGAIAQANGGAGRAGLVRAAANGGISLRPDTVEHVARRGNVGRVTIKNTTNGTLRTTVTVRPWSQNRTTGNVSENYRVNLSPYVVANKRTFNLGAGRSRTVTMRVRRTPPHGSLYAALDVFAKQLHVKKHNGIIPQYRVVGRVRLNPKHKRPALKIGTANIIGPMRKTVNLTPASIVPGQVVYVRALNISGMKKGLYHVTFNVTQGTRHWRANRIFGVH